MTEKRFRVNDSMKFNYSEIGEYVDENHTPIPLRNDEVCKLLNEQQATIRKLQDLCGESDGENAKLRIENEKLRKELGDCEKFRYTVFKRLNEEYIKERSIK